MILPVSEFIFFSFTYQSVPYFIRNKTDPNYICNHFCFSPFIYLSSHSFIHPQDFLLRPSACPSAGRPPRISGSDLVLVRAPAGRPTKWDPWGVNPPPAILERRDGFRCDDGAHLAERIGDLTEGSARSQSVLFTSPPSQPAGRPASARTSTRSEAEILGGWRALGQALGRRRKSREWMNE